jgi:DNA-binding PadR family transcriptional regulator
VLKYVLLGLLAKGPAHGYELRAAVQEMFGGTWDLNVGQVYTTLSRLERDGLVESERVAQEAFPDRRVCSLTEAGSQVLLDWLPTPVPETHMKQEMFAKVMLHAMLDAGDAVTFIRLQRQRCLEELAALNKRRVETEVDGDPASTLVIDGAMFHVNADVDWLEQCEARLADIKGARR